MRPPATLRWIGLALLGLAIAAAVAIAAGNLASQQIGIASESISAGDRLAPPTPATRRVHRAPDKGGGGRRETSPPPPTTPEPPTPEPPASTVAPPPGQGDDYGGASAGGEGSDD